MKDKMSYFNSRALFSGITFSYLFSICGTNFWISSIVGTILGVIALLFIKDIQNKKMIKMISGFTLTIISCIVLVNMGHTLYLKDTPLIFLTLLPIVASLVMSNCKNAALKKVTSIFFIYSIFLFFLKVLGLYSHIEMKNLRPLFQASIGNTLWGSIVFMLVGVVPIISLNDTSDKKNTILTYLVSMITAITVSFLAVSVLGIQEVQIYRYPEYVVLKRIEFLNFVNNVDNFFNFAIIIDLLFTMTAGFKNMNSYGKTTKYILAFIIYLLTMWMCEKSSLLLYLYEYLPFIFIFLLIILIIPKKSMYKKSV